MKFEEFTHIGEKSPGKTTLMCEDRLFCHENLFAVIDGATSTTGTLIEKLTDGAYIAEFFKKSLNNYVNSQLDAHDIMVEINKKFGEHLKTQHPEIHALEKNGPTASGVIVKIHSDNTYSFAQVGDCMLVESQTGKLNELTIDSRYVDDHDYLHIAQKISKQKGLGILEVREYPEVINAIVAHRLKSNVEKGVLNGDLAMDNFICHDRRPLKNVSELILMSDGMAHPEYELKDTYIEAAKHMLEKSIYHYYKTLKAILDADCDWKNLKYLRGKHIDDCTAVIAKF